MTEEQKLIRAIARAQAVLARATGAAMGMSLSDKIRLKAAYRKLEEMAQQVRLMTFEFQDAERAIKRATEE